MLERTAEPVVSAATERHPVGALTPRLVVQGVVKTWGRRSPVLDGVDLTLAPGELVLLTGQNGAGKTTLVRIAGGLIAPDRGRVLVDGLEPLGDRREYQRKIGFLSATHGGLYARLSPRQHLEYWARLALLARPHRDQAIARVSRLFALDEIVRQRVDRLSMGQRQRVRLAMTFLHEPRLVLLDEPRNSLDLDATALLLAALAELTATGGTAVWCAPTGDEGDAPFDRSYVLEHGRVVQR